ncbi:MAG TPA: hypothetical protein VFE33_07960 [Thermoanaerobaculia bacterium]|nr:hypothetical protein [Thermoanaerobaculia bacterium]
MTALRSRVLAVADLTAAEIAALYGLFDETFVALPERFERDLAQKDRVILLEDAATGTLQGFTSLLLYETEAAGRRLSVVYSGDTVVRPAFWGTPELPRAWFRTISTWTDGLRQPLYWLLITSGYRTYRFLPVFFREFYPCHDRPTPALEQALLDQLATERFGLEFDRERGIVRFAEGATPLRAGAGEATSGRRKDPHVDFFFRRNPGQERGDELVCLARIHPDNLTAAARRMAR